MPETASGGVGLFDYNGDGWLDIYFVQGGPFPPGPGRPSPGDRLFRNRGDGTFDDVTTESGVSRSRADMATAWLWATSTTTGVPTSF